MKFGDYIKACREKHGWTQPEAAAKATIEQSYLSKLETGKSYPSQEMYAKLVEAYAIDTAEMCGRVQDSELDKLRDIAQVRGAILNRQKLEISYLRSWLLAGLAMLMLGTGLAMYQTHQGYETEVTYKYQSPGIIRAGEPMGIFETLEWREQFKSAEIANLLKENAAADLIPITLGESYSDRADFKILSFKDNIGPSFVREVTGGKRRYELVGEINRDRLLRNDFILALGAALIMGGFGCFYLSRRWR